MTLGKRIMENRKRLGLTQDALAEQLGVTAQAVSKWENDQSCPDITTLPKLADLFGISVDALLGRESQTVHTAEVVDEEACENEGVHLNKGCWEFRWDSGRKDAVFFAVFVLLVGSLTLTAKLLSLDTGFWDILWPSALLTIGLHRICSRFSFFGIGCTLFGGYFLLENMNVTNLDLAGELIFPVLIVIFGLSLLADALRKPKKPRFQINRNGVKLCDENGKAKATTDKYTVDGESFTCQYSFGEGNRYVALPRLSGGQINMSFGELTVDLSGCEEIADGCLIDANCSFGELVILVPKRYRVAPDSRNAFASLSTKGQPDPEPAATIQLAANISFGEITVKYI